MLRIYEQKHGSKIAEILASLPRQDAIVLNAAVLLFGDSGEEKSAQLKMLFEETEMECEVREVEKMDFKQFMNCVDELEYYNLLKIDRNKREPKLSNVTLNVDLEELKRELAILQTPDTHIGK